MIIMQIVQWAKVMVGTCWTSVRRVLLLSCTDAWIATNFNGLRTRYLLEHISCTERNLMSQDVPGRDYAV